MCTDVVGMIVCVHSPCSKYMDECTCWLPLNPASHVVIILILCFTAHTTLSPSSLWDNNLTDDCTEAVSTLIMNVKSLTYIGSVTPQTLCMWHSAVHTDPLHHMAHNVVCVVLWSGSAYTTCALIMSAVSTDPLHF